MEWGTVGRRIEHKIIDALQVIFPQKKHQKTVLCLVFSEKPHAGSSLSIGIPQIGISDS